MYIFKNAFKNITRNKGRNILIGTIILVVACSCAVTLAIKNSATKLIDSYASQYQTIASIGIDRKAMMGNFDPSSKSSTDMDSLKETFASIASVTIDDVKNYVDSSYVSSYYYTESLGLNSSNLTAATSTKGKGGPEQTSTTDFTLTGYSSYEAMSEFISGSYTITSGSVDSDFTADTCVINSELATLNSIDVGDTITLVNPNETTLTYTLTVTGIFEDSSEASGGFSMFTNSVNNIITNSSVIENIANADTSLKNTVTPSFVLTDSSVVDAFQTELYGKGMSEYYTVSTNLDQVESATSTVSNVSTFATTFLIITLVIGGVVLIVINMINIRERKYEIGVLRTIGMKKFLLTFQFMAELFMVSIVALMIGAGIGACISTPISNSLLASEISSSKTSSDNINANFGGKPSETSSSDTVTKPTDTGKMNGVVSVQAYDSIDAVVNFTVLLELLGLGLALTLISGASSMISIQKFSPLTILKERS